SRLLDGDGVAPPAALRERRPAHRAARNLALARARAGRDLPRRADRPGAAARRRARVPAAAREGAHPRDPALLPARDRGDGRRAGGGRGARRPGRLGEGGGDAVRPVERRVKRALDAAVAALGLTAGAPLIAACAAAIKLEDGGPVFYRQERIGRDGRA